MSDKLVKRETVQADRPQLLEGVHSLVPRTAQGRPLPVQKSSQLYPTPGTGCLGRELVPHTGGESHGSPWREFLQLHPRSPHLTQGGEGDVGMR